MSEDNERELTNFSIVRDSIMNEMRGGENKIMLLIGADSNVCGLIRDSGIKDPDFVYDGKSVRKFMNADMGLFIRSMLELDMSTVEWDYKIYAVVSFREMSPFCQCFLMRSMGNVREMFNQKEKKWEPLKNVSGENAGFLDDPGKNAMMQSVADEIEWPKEMLRPEAVAQEVHDNGMLMKIYDKVEDVARFQHLLDPSGQDNMAFLLPADKSRLGSAVVQEKDEAVLYMRLTASDVIRLDEGDRLPREFNWLIDKTNDLLKNGTTSYLIWHKVYSTPLVSDMAEVLMFMWDHCPRKRPVMCIPLSRHAYLQYRDPYIDGEIIKSQEPLAPTEEEEQNIIYFEQGGGIDGMKQ